jgi:tetratricopeptide (TPR) repeat protein
MIPTSREEQKKEAFRLFEDGRYLESLGACTHILKTGRDPDIEVLAATNSYYTGKFEDAEASFRDLARKMPDSSYVHSYLAKVLEARGDEGAIGEYATAVRLDPTNQDALRMYAGYLLKHRDYRGALPVLRRLVRQAKRPEDIKNLMRVLTEIDEAEEALATHSMTGVDAQKTREYIDALVKTGNYRAAAESASALYRETKDPSILRKYLAALSGYDVPASLDAYSSVIAENPDSDILFDYILLLKSEGEYAKAMEATQSLLSSTQKPVYRLVECDLLAAQGKDEEALVTCESLIREELNTRDDPDTLGLVISKYRQYLKKSLPTDKATRRFLDLVARDINVVSLLGTARLYQEQGNPGEARAWYYRAYRTDFLSGGLDYAKFLSENGELRECEKVMLYILSNAKKGRDLKRVAAVVIDKRGPMSRMKRLMEQLIRRLWERRAMLDSEGMELLAVGFFIAATDALEDTDYAHCKYYCLCGMDVIPAHTREIRLEQYLQLIRACKEQSVADHPIMHAPQEDTRELTEPQAQAVFDQLGLSDQEQKIIGFLRSHRRASEMDLRKVLGTRRVVGIVNKLVQKAASQGLSLVEKKGVGEDGEVYEYTGI